MLRFTRLTLVLLLFSATVLSADPLPSAPPGPLDPAKEQDTFVLSPGLQIELVAAEPQIESPVAMAFGADGKLWVVEMRDYPNGPAPGEKPLGRIKVLADQDGDGRFETASIFADELLYANGLLPWKDGLIVTAAPHILFLRDTDHDGKCDSREILYEGFAVANPQLRVSHPILGLDGWVYVANGLRGGKIIRHGDPNAKPVDISGMDFRFRPDGGEGEAVSGMGQYGNTFDDWGHRFVCDNRHHLRHVVMPAAAIKRNPLLAVPEVVEDISETNAEVNGAGSKIYPLSRNWTTSNLHAGRFTAACGVFIYRGDLLPAEFNGAAFTCDPTGNLLHVEMLRPHGGTFRSRPPREGVEFLASPDEWFRPVSLAHGPDGALYLIDMYRAVIEHPEWMPVELQKRPDLDLGRDKGRIWRIVPAGARRAATVPASRPESTTPNSPPPYEAGGRGGVTPGLDTLPSADLVRQLEHPNAWHRDTAHRLLLERTTDIQDLLKRLLSETKSPQARVHAAWLLRNRGGLELAQVSSLLNDSHPRVRESGAILGAANNSLSIAELTQLAGDSDSLVRFQAAVAAGDQHENRAATLLAKIVVRAADDRWTRIAVASGAAERSGFVLHLVLKELVNAAELTADELTLIRELATIANNPANVEMTLINLLGGEAAPTPSFTITLTGLNGLTEGLGRRGASLSRSLDAIPEDRRKGYADLLVNAYRQAAERALNPLESLELRHECVSLLAHAPWDIAEKPLKALVADATQRELRIAAVRSLGIQPRPDIAPLLLDGWRGYPPAVRREVVEALFRRPDRLPLLVDAVEAGTVRPVDIDAGRTKVLLNHADVAIKDRAKKLLDATPEDRKAVLERYQEALKIEGHPERGRQVFSKICAACHRIGDVGQDVGPSIADTRTKTAAQLLADVLNPNQAIDANFVQYVIETKAGRVVSGVIAVETATSVTLKRAENQTDVVLRPDIVEMSSTGLSLMPANLEANITVPEMADLLSFLKNWRYLDGRTPLK